jgi:glycerophosphoryl diester phosphodiesterase
MPHRTLILGHRGTISKPENTLAAFQKAIEAGADGIELDVQKTLDGIIVVSHDENLKRTTGVNFDIRKNTYDELKKISIEGEKVPTLSEVLDFIFEKKKIVDIELKNPDDLLQLIELLKKTKLGDFYISSFYHNVIFTAKKEFPQFRFAYI